MDMPLTVYWGCTLNSRLPKIKDSMLNILERAGLGFREFEGDSCCGLPLFLAGDLGEARRRANGVIGKLADAGTVLTPCAGCYATFAERYPRMLGLQSPFRVMHSAHLIDQLLAEGRLTLVGKGQTIAAYHDPCELVRRCGVYAEPRRALASMPEVKLVESGFSGERSNCCGGGGLLPSSFPELAIEIASMRISRDIMPLRPDVLVTGCPSCYLNFSRAIERGEFGIRLLDISEIVAERMGER